jgi:SAM-dependent methyltransferase
MIFYESIARYYDAENQHFTADLAFYEALAEEHGSPILDVGCGTGRVNLHLAQAGYPTVGVDSSAEMLAIARRKIQAVPHLADHARLVQSDILAFQAGCYPLILLPYNALMHFTTPALQRQVMTQLASLLSDDGIIALDLPNAGEAYAAEDMGGIVLERTFIEPITGHVVMQQSVSYIERATQLLNVTWIYDEILPDKTLKRTLEPLTLRYVFPTELEWLLALAGLRIEEQFGDYDQAPFAEGSPRLIVLATKA